jgi:hypothetical protein
MMDTFLKGISNHLELPYLECVHHVSEWVFTMSPVHTKGEGGAKHRVRGKKMLLCTPHPPLRGTLSLQERDSSQTFSNLDGSVYPGGAMKPLYLPYHPKPIIRIAKRGWQAAAMSGSRTLELVPP